MLLDIIEAMLLIRGLSPWQAHHGAQSMYTYPVPTGPQAWKYVIEQAERNARPPIETEK